MSERIVLGFDPGLERLGFGVVTRKGSELRVGEYGLISTPRVEISQRLQIIYRESRSLIERVRPDEIAMERLFFAKNQTTALDVAKAIGVVMLACEEVGISCCEYSPPEVKLAVTGRGNAEKKQVQFMICKLLGLSETPKPDDVADALAIAITHALRAPITLGKLSK